MKIYYFVLLIGVLHLNIFAQVDTTNIANTIENILEDATRDQEDSQIFDLFEELINNPININSATVNDLLKIPFLNYVEAQEIINYRNRVVEIKSQTEFMNIKNLNTELIRKIVPFIDFSPADSTNIFYSLSQLLLNTNFMFRSRVIHDLQKRSGFADSLFRGSRPKYYNRLQLSASKKIKMGILFEKDAGENSFADFTSFNLSIKKLGMFNNIVIGDYIFEFGQGLSIWSPYGFSKGSDAVGTTARNPRGAKPFTSSDENRFLRGVTFQITKNNFYVCPFFSSNLIDASIDSTTKNISALVIDGYHRTVNEINKKDNLKETIFGITTSYSFGDRVKVGLLYYKSTYSQNFEKSSLKGKDEFEHFSASYNSIINKLFLSGELAFANNSFASINTINFCVNKILSLSFSYRNFSPHYFSFKGNSFGEKGTAQNETGFYSGLRLSTKFGLFNVYYDQFSFPAGSSNYSFSSSGNDFLIFYTYKVFENTEIGIKYKNENKDVDAVVANQNILIERNSRNYRFEISYKILNNLRFKSRFEFVNISEANISKNEESGYLFFQDAVFQPMKNFVLYGRIIFFQTDSYNSRVYEFENDLSGVMTNSPLFGEGVRWYFILKYKTHFGLDLSLKYSELHKPFEKSLGSGYSEIKGNIDNRLSFQLDFIF